MPPDKEVWKQFSLFFTRLPPQDFIQFALQKKNFSIILLNGIVGKQIFSC